MISIQTGVCVLTGFGVVVVVDFGVVVVVELVSCSVEFPATWSSDTVSFDSLFLRFNVRAFNSCNLHVNTVVPPKPSVSKVSDDE